MPAQGQKESRSEPLSRGPEKEVVAVERLMGRGAAREGRRLAGLPGLEGQNGPPFKRVLPEGGRPVPRCGAIIHTAGMSVTVSFYHGDGPSPLRLALSVPLRGSRFLSGVAQHSMLDQSGCVLFPS